MAKYVIEGGNKLSGEIVANAGKNYILPVMAATLLTTEQCTLRNVPKIRDVDYMLKLLEHIGSTYSYLDDHTIQIQTKDINNTDLPQELVTKLRASVLLLGSLLAKAGKASTYHPGGDVIGRRSIDSHLFGFEQMGAKVARGDSTYQVEGLDLGGTVVFDEISVTGSENIILAAAGSTKETHITHAAIEPHVQELCKLLQKMGAVIDGIGTHKLTITGSADLKGFDHTFGSDHVEVGTWMILAGTTQSTISIKNVNINYLDMIFLLLSRFGVSYKLEKQADTGGLTFDYEPYIVHVIPGDLKAVHKVDALPWPGFPTDLISILIVLATQAQGITLIRDWMYEGRMFFTDKLITMGANIVLCDPHRVIVYGRVSLTGKYLESPDLRAGMALVLAALIAKGESIISNIEHIERDYADIVERLSALGAKISRQDD